MPENEKEGQVKLAASVYVMIVGRLDWIRTNDPHHVKVVL
jgi:hypothetical protein